ncbi:prolyl oligopeptidase family serine peptidase [Halobaculum sp. CBA1158]|uniref:S9 family peptidase n=1 Tax=Halobaculum sp. CBA1158 TaxID=2904243 RepID=UPI001F35BD06|nr:prolyl oligopeptidase family serine peptidase [Halobaculum sp. CBA1158]UIP01091.1 prolyl oligopeptidase family serine peptidase [Halobaculum sp. CBA1158]
MYRRDLRDTSADDLLSAMAAADGVVQAEPSPDGDRVAYAKAREGQIDLWLWDGTTDTRLTSGGITAQRYGRGDPRWIDWHPDGDAVAFLSAAGSLSTVDAETGEVTALTAYDEPDLGLAYAPDGDDLAVVTDHFSRASLALVAADGSRVEALADDEYLYGDPAVGADGTVYATRAEHRHLFDYEADLVAVDRDRDGDGDGDGDDDRDSGGSGRTDGVREVFAEEGVRVQNVRPRPDSTEVAFVHDASGFDAVAVVDDAGAAVGSDGDAAGDAEELYAVDGAEVADPAWSPSGRTLAVTVTRDARANVHVVDRDGYADEVTDDDAFHTAPRWVDGDVLAVRDTPHDPPAVWNVSAGERVTPGATPDFGVRVPTPETVTYESGDEEIQAVVYPPEADSDAESVPVLVKAHGGPTSFDRFRFDHRAAYLAALGYCVILPNYRGSDGYGRAFRMANDRDWGGGDLEDVIRAADAAAEAYDAVDGDRAGIYGGSGGGLMTVNALGNSDRFAAGAAFYGVYDYETFLDDTDDVGWQLMKRELGDVATDPENYCEASPIRHVEDIEDPLLVLHGEDDARVPISQSEQLCEELERHGKRFEFRRYDGEPHGFGDRENVVDAYTRVADLFAKYLRVDPDDGSSSPHPTDEPDRTSN